jgi:hypothetical protein
VSFKLVRDVLASSRFHIFDKICPVHFTVCWVRRWRGRGQTLVLFCLDLKQYVCTCKATRAVQCSTKSEISARLIEHWKAKPLNELLTCNLNPICYEVRMRFIADPLSWQIRHVRNTGGCCCVEPCKLTSYQIGVWNETWNVLYFPQQIGHVCALHYDELEIEFVFTVTVRNIRFLSRGQRR